MKKCGNMLSFLATAGGHPTTRTTGRPIVVDTYLFVPHGCSFLPDGVVTHKVREHSEALTRILLGGQRLQEAEEAGFQNALLKFWSVIDESLEKLRL